MKFNDNTPIYLQIVEKIKADIVAGKLKGGDKLPSVREIAESFNVNPNTVQRVYLELEREGIAYPQRGIGTFVTEGDEIVERLRSTQARKFIQRYVNDMRGLGMDDNQIVQSLEKFLEGEEHDYTEG
jgi:GntR family transcriptional regulator